MNLPISAGGTMTTLDLRALINEARQAFGEPIVRNDKFLDRVRDELDGELGGCKKIPHPQSGVEMEFYDLNRDQCMLVAMRESKGVRRRVVDKLNVFDRPMTPAELIAASANQMVAFERQQAAHQVAIERVQGIQADHARLIEDLSHSHVWDHCPQNCLSLTGIKAEMSKRYGLSGPVVDFVLKHWMHQPHPAGMVRNGHEEARGSQYQIWAKTSVTMAFKRFVAGCQMVTPTQAEHPDIEGRFQLRLKGSV